MRGMGMLGLFSSSVFGKGADGGGLVGGLRLSDTSVLYVPFSFP